MTIDVGWIPLIFGLSFALGAISAWASNQLFDSEANRSGMAKDFAGMAKDLGCADLFVPHSLAADSRAAELRDKRRAMVEAYAKNSVVHIVTRPNRAWRKWSKPGRTRISSRP